MKKWMCILLTAMLVFLMANVLAEGESSVDRFANRLKKASEKMEMQNPAIEMDEEDNSFGPALKIQDPFYKKIRSSAYMQKNTYSEQANVMIELQNVSGRVLYPSKASIIAYDGRYR